MANRLSRSLDHIEAHTPAKVSGANNGGGIVSKYGQQIEQVDHMYTKIRGGRHEGDVERIVTSKEEADAEGVKHLPKVLFTDQKGKDVAHNRSTLDVTDKA